jgi:hypothetical protein
MFFGINRPAQTSNMAASVNRAVPVIISLTWLVQLASVSELLFPVVAKIRKLLVIKNNRVIFDHGKARPAVLVAKAAVGYG